MLEERYEHHMATDLIESFRYDLLKIQSSGALLSIDPLIHVLEYQAYELFGEVKEMFNETIAL
jgi:hypothetical protein